jgi:hypothetical protein
MTRRGTKPKAALNPRPAAQSSSVSAGTEAGATGYARLLELALLLGGLAYAIVFWLRLPGQLPDEKDYLALQAAIQSEIRPGDGAAVLPFWAERAKLFLHGTPVLALPHLEAEADAERYARLWVIAQPELPHSDARDTLNALGQRLDLVHAPRHFGPLELWLFTPRPSRAATYDFVAHAGEARVQSPVPVRTEWREFDFLPRHCLLSQAGQAILHFDAVPIHNGLRVGLGSLGPPGETQILASVDGHPLQPLGLTEPGAGFQEAELATGGLSGDTHSVDITLLGRAVCADAVAF